MPDTVGGWIGALLILIGVGAVLGSMVPALVRRWPIPQDRKHVSRYPDGGDGSGGGEGGGT